MGLNMHFCEGASHNGSQTENIRGQGLKVMIEVLICLSKLMEYYV